MNKIFQFLFLKAAPTPPALCRVYYLANFTADAVQPFVFKMKLLNIRSYDK